MSYFWAVVKLAVEWFTSCALAAKTVADMTTTLAELNPNSEVAARAERGCPQPQRFEHTGAVQKFSGRSSFRSEERRGGKECCR